MDPSAVVGSCEIGMLCAGFEWWYVESILVTAFCRLVARNRDFQQLKGRRVEVVDAIVLMCSSLTMRLGSHPRTFAE